MIGNVSFSITSRRTCLFRAQSYELTPVNDTDGAEVYTEITNFPVSTVQGHKGALVFGTIGTKKVVAMPSSVTYHIFKMMLLPS